MSLISPLGKYPLTLTTTLTFPPGEGLEGLIPCADTITLSRDLNDGLEAVDCCIIIMVEDIIDILVAAVLPLIPEAPEMELVDECANC